MVFLQKSRTHAQAFEGRSRKVSVLLHDVVLYTDLLGFGNYFVPCEVAVSDLGDTRDKVVFLVGLEVSVLKVENVYSTLQLVEPVGNIGGACGYPAGVENEGDVVGIEFLIEDTKKSCLIMI